MKLHRVASSLPSIAAVLVTPLAAPASAQSNSTDIVFQADTRLRYEFADIDGAQDTGEALTLRIRPSVEVTPVKGLTVLAEVEAIASVLPDSRNGFVSGGLRPDIADEETIELNRLQLEFAPSERFSATIGRQRISLDDERFIGIVDFRQNQQTYDAVTVSYQGPADLVVRAGYVWRVGRVIGAEQPDGVFDSDSFFINAALPLPFGQISGFHYDLDLDDRVNPAQKTQTTGVAFRGRAFPGDFGLFYEAGFAVQQSSGSSPEYARAALRVERGEVGLATRFERLGSDAGVAFQTPLATLHRFQGAADLFLVTPPDGIDDLEVRADWRIGSLGALRGTRLAVQHNSYWPATGKGQYGAEWGAEIATILASTRLSLAASHYRAEDFAADTSRVWLTVARKF